MSLDAKHLLQRLVRTPSVNPAFLGGQETAAGEADLGRLLEGILAECGFGWLRQTVHPGRDNLIAVCPAASSDDPQRVTLWEVHQNTVDVVGMQVEPFAARESDGRIWGRGTCDVKGGMAAMLSALARAQSAGGATRGPVVVALTVNEECGFTGAQALCRLWGDEATAAAEAEHIRGPLALADLRELRPQRAIVAEPTLLNIVVAHKGVLRWRCHTRGQAAHSSQPDQGANAVYGISEVVQAIQGYQRDVLSLRAAHPLCGPPTVCVSTIQGGSGTNTVPDHAVIDIDRRLVPRESPEEAYRELVDFAANRVQVEPVVIEHEPPWLTSSGLDSDNNLDWAEEVAAAARNSGRASEIIGVPYGTDAAAISALGIPTVVFGPGSIDQAHTVDEWLAVDQLERATEVFFRLAMGEAD